MAVVVDLFAGLGGFSEGARQAGARVAWAANHWEEAVAVHRANHPETAHACQDLHQARWADVPRHDLLLASPACQGHSRALQADSTYHDELRSTAWAVTACLEVQRPAAFVVENVPEFEDWQLYDVWRLSLDKLGYKVTRQVLNATAFGVPQNRDRLFVVGHRKKLITIRPPRIQAPSMRSLIRWDHRRWSPLSRCRSPIALRQIRNGRNIHGERFLIGYHSDKYKGVSLDGPIGTLTTKDQWAVVDHENARFRMLTLEEYLEAMGFPASYLLPRTREQAIHMIGNAVCPPVAAEVVRQVLAA